MLFRSLNLVLQYLTLCFSKKSGEIKYSNRYSRTQRGMHLGGSLFTDPLLSFQSPSGAGDKMGGGGGRSRSRALASLASSPRFSKRTKRKIKQRLCTGYTLRW